MSESEVLGVAPAGGMAATGGSGLTYRGVLALALPIILSNITTPLLGVTNTAVVGRLGEPSLIGAVALSAVIFSLLFWAFGFLRMGTTGLCAQADGAGDHAGVSAILMRALLIASGASLILLLLQWPLGEISFYLLDAPADVETQARLYFAIRIWSAPFALANYAFLGWFIGLGRMRIALMLQLVLNGANVLLSIALVAGLGWGVPGVATATVFSEALAAGLIKMLAVNSDLMIRTLCLLAAFSFFTAQGAKSGEIILAANAILINLFEVAAYLLDGFAFTTEVLTGRAIGAAAKERFRRAVRLSTVWAAGGALAVGLVFLTGGGAIIDAMTTSAEVRQAARAYLPWAIIAPIVGVACFQLDGIFIGATRTRDMRNMMIVSLVLFLVAWAVLMPAFGNHGLWASMLVFLVARGATLAAHFPALERASFGARERETPSARRPQP